MVDPLQNEASNPISELSREEILKQIFGDIGEIIDDFTCAVESTVLLHGRMYITNRFICFYSNLFGLEKKIRIPYSHIKNITKENTVMVIPNAISISTDKRDYLFRSFWDREDCFRILRAFWEKFKSGGSITMADYVRVSQRISKSNNPTQNSEDATTESAKAVEGTTVTPSAPGDTSSSRRLSVRKGLGDVDEVFDTESGSDRPGSVNYTAPSGDIISQFNTEVTKAKLKHAVVSGTLNISLADFAALFIDDKAPYNFKRYHESVKDTNLDVTLWSNLNSPLGADREIKFFKPVNLPGLASTRGVKLQRYRKFGDYGLILLSSTRLEDVPAADTFSVDDVLTVNKIDDNKINVEITFQVTFMKSTYMKFIIERSTNVEMMKWLDVFFQHLKATSEMLKDGKISLDSAPVDATPVASTETTTESTSTETTITSATPVAIEVSSVSQVAVSNNNSPKGGVMDKLKWVLLALFVLLLALNYYRMSSMNSQLSDLQQKVKLLEETIQKISKA